MSTALLYHEPAHHEPAPAPGAGSGPEPWLSARAEALFASDLSARRQHTRAEVSAAITRAIGAHHGLRGCAGEVAAAYGERPETAARRMLWARAVIEDIYGGVNDAGAPGGGVRHRPSLVERGYVPGRFGGVPVFVGPELAAQIKATRQKQS